MSDIVEIKDLTKKFRTQVALDNISITLPQGKITGLVGPDAAGKTTLIRVITGLMKPDSGTIKINGADMRGNQKELSGFIGYMPQKFGLYEDLSVIENLKLYARLHDLTQEEQEESFKKMLEFTDLERFTERLAGNLSGGMKQKLGLACSLLGHPKLLLLDEPGVGVDPISRRELWGMVNSLMDGEMSVLWSTSYLDEAEKCEKVILLNESKKLFEGIPSDLTDKLQGRVWLLENSTGDRRHTLTKVLQHKNVIDAVIQGSSIRIVTAENTPESDLKDLVDDSKGKLTKEKPRFEDAFIDMLGGGPGGDSPLADIFPGFEKDSKIVVEANSLTKKYGNFTAANNISFKITRGEIFGLLGPNGAGKSTTFKMLCGLITPTSGDASIVGYDLQKRATLARSQIGYMAQKFSLYDGLSLKQNLDFFAGIYGLGGAEARERIAKMIDIFKFKEYLNDNSGDLPLGIKQRLALACAVMHNPSVLFLDEPTSGVSPVTRREFWTHINRLVEKGVTVMITTHFMDEAEYCDRISLIYRSKSIAEGTPDELKERVKSDELKDPRMEDAFIALINEQSKKEKEGGS